MSLLLNRKAQAATELAVLGALIIVAFSFLINYSEKLNRQQSYIMQTFRAALKAAKDANGSASYTKVAFRRLPNVSSPYELGQLESFSNSANVLWSNGNNDTKESQNVTYRNPDGTVETKQENVTVMPQVSKYQLNEDTAIDLPAQETPFYNTTRTSTSTFTNIVDSTVTFVKSERPGAGISTTKSLVASDTLQANVTIDGNAYSFTHYLGPDGKYYNDTRQVERNITLR